MCANLTYCGDLGLLCTAYDHYLNYVLAEKYKNESKEKGWNEREVERKVVHWARQRLCDWHYKFLVANNYAKRYQVIASDGNACSDDEYNSKAGMYVIKTLAYQSKNATAFFCRLDCKIKEVEKIMGCQSNQQIRWSPKIPIISKFKKTPKNAPIDFYRPKWFNEPDRSQKLMVADLLEAEFVPIKELPPGGKQHPNERLGYISFNYKYWDSTIKDYEIEPRTSQSSNKDSNDGSLGDDESVDLDMAMAQKDVDNHLVNKKIMEIEKGEIELEPEEIDEDY
ncbi:hypothetical protein O181_062179 [Austropuccinia psidii MF-1]|uniref:Uncharacterized protein n=1 Tax=Austropuccinia psidii MF-1 TaxID=1389203 RepID=A0A9Q3EJM6_9BASI|nr:hypothetical protein [Austropuccinia psidii MF-1]